MKKTALLLVLFLFCLSSVLQAQEDENENNYLIGAVPEKDGRVIFSKEFNLPGMSNDQIFDKVQNWMEKRLKKNNNVSRIAYSDKEKGSIAGLSQEYIVFKSGALSLDQTLIKYQITATCLQGKCLVNIERISYIYQNDEKFPAEEWITDKYALNKNKTKLMRGYAKFRTKTVDLVNALFANAQTAMGAVSTEAQTSTKISAITDKPDVSSIPAIAESSNTATLSSSMPGYKQISPDKIPGNIIKMLSEDWMLITAGTNEQFNMMTASWGGLGVLFGKPVTFCFINPARYTYQLMEKNNSYTLTFYTETYRDALKYCGSKSGKDTDKIKGSGLTPVTTPTGSKAFSEAWLIIECRKLVSQSLTPEVLSDESIKKEWTGKQMHKMFIGEIINVWVK